MLRPPGGGGGNWKPVCAGAALGARTAPSAGMRKLSVSPSRSEKSWRGPSGKCGEGRGASSGPGPASSDLRRLSSEHRMVVPCPVLQRHCKVKALSALCKLASATRDAPRCQYTHAAHPRSRHARQSSAKSQALLPPTCPSHHRGMTRRVRLRQSAPPTCRAIFQTDLARFCMLHHT